MFSGGRERFWPGLGMVSVKLMGRFGIGRGLSETHQGSDWACFQYVSKWFGYGFDMHLLGIWAGRGRGPTCWRQTRTMDYQFLTLVLVVASKGESAVI